MRRRFGNVKEYVIGISDVLQLIENRAAREEPIVGSLIFLAFLNDLD